MTAVTTSVVKPARRCDWRTRATWGLGTLLLALAAGWALMPLPGGDPSLARHEEGPSPASIAAAEAAPPLDVAAFHLPVWSLPERALDLAEQVPAGAAPAPPPPYAGQLLSIIVPGSVGSDSERTRRAVFFDPVLDRVRQLAEGDAVDAHRRVVKIEPACVRLGPAVDRTGSAATDADRGLEQVIHLHADVHRSTP